MTSGSDAAAKREPRFQELCDRIYGSGGVLACYVVNIGGEVLGQNFGQVVASDELRSKYGVLASLVWGGLKNIEAIGGPLLLLSATYENFKVIGIPIPDSEVGIIATVEPGSDEIYRRKRILDTFCQWTGSG